VTGERIHGFVDLVFIETLIGRQAASLGEQRARGALREGQLGARKEQSGEDDGLEQRTLTGSADALKKTLESGLLPGIENDGETAIIESVAELEGVGGDKRLAGERIGDELADVLGKIGNVADGA
jgi:hypothetical protein